MTSAISPLIQPAPLTGLLLGPLPAEPLDGASEGHIGSALPLLGGAFVSRHRWEWLGDMVRMVEICKIL